MKHEPPHACARNDEATNLLLFPDEPPAPPAPRLTNAPPTPESSTLRNVPLSLAQIIAEWRALLTRLGRRRREGIHDHCRQQRRLLRATLPRRPEGRRGLHELRVIIPRSSCR